MVMVRVARASPMRSSSPISVVIARFDDLLARGLRQVIDDDGNLEIVAADVDYDRLGVTLRAHRPRVAILDVDALSSLSEVRRLTESYPETQLVLLVSRETTAECVQALAFGASAFLGRDTQARDVLNAIYLASRGHQLIPRAARAPSRRQVPGHSLLTQREAEVLPMLQTGSSNKEIATALHVGTETIRTHARNIYRKLGVSSRRELSAIPPRVPASPESDVSAPAVRRRLASQPGRHRRPGALRH